MTQEAEAAVEAVALAIAPTIFREFDGDSQERADAWKKHASERDQRLIAEIARAAIAAYEATLRPAIEAEIVAWLRGESAVRLIRDDDDEGIALGDAADAIQAGDHRAILPPVTPE